MNKNKIEVVELQNSLYTSSNPTRRWLHCSRRDWVEKALRQEALGMKSDITNALEVGPGSGVYLPTLCSLFTHVVASDIEDAHLHALNPMLEDYANLELLEDDIINSKQPEGKFDLILCSEVIEHIPSTDGVVKGLYRLLKPDGCLIITTPQKYSSLELCAKIGFLPIVIDIVRMIYREPIKETGHINLLTDHMMEHSLTNVGFNIQKKQKIALYIPLVAEFFGDMGKNVSSWMQKKILGTWLDFLIWTQCYVVRKRD